MKTPEQLDAANQYSAYWKGWTAGACVRAMDPAVAGHADKLLRDAYNQGYHDGGVARNDAMLLASERYGHVPNILRLAETGGAEAS